MRAQRRPVTSPQATAPSAPGRDQQEEPGLAERRRRAQVRLADAHRDHDRERRGPEGLQPDQHPGRADGSRRAVGSGAVVAGHGIEDRRGYAARVRALLVVNPNATTTTAAGRDVLAHALASELKLEVLLTRYRGHAAEATAQAVRDGVELLVAHGGDGTVNEVVNGMLQGTGGPVGARPGGGPALAVVPGGSANVFARALGMPRDPVEATAQVLRALGSGAAGWSASAGPTTGGSPSTPAWGGTRRRRGGRSRCAFGLAATPLRYAATGLRQYSGSGATPSR